MHSSCEGATKHHTSSTVVIEPFEFGSTLFATWRDFTHSDFVADHFHGLCALRDAPKL